MANMSLKKNEMPTQEPSVRAKNFDEVALGYTEAMAIDEAMRCIDCKNTPCVSACPVNIRSSSRQGFRRSLQQILQGLI